MFFLGGPKNIRRTIVVDCQLCCWTCGCSDFEAKAWIATSEGETVDMEQKWPNRLREETVIPNPKFKEYIYIYTYTHEKWPLAPKSKREKCLPSISYLSWGWAWESPSQMFLQLGSLETKLFLFWKSCCKLAGHLVHLATVVCAGVAGYHLCASWRWRNIATNLDQVQLAELVDWTKVDASNSWPHP